MKQLSKKWKWTIVIASILLIVVAGDCIVLFFMHDSPAHDDKIWIRSYYAEDFITLNIDGYYFDQSLNGIGKARYHSKKSEEEIIAEIRQNGAHFFEVGGYKFFTLDGCDGVFNLRFEESDRGYERCVIFDDLNCYYEADGEATLLGMPFPYFLLLGERDFEWKLTDRIYGVDEELFLSVVNGLDLWTLTQENENYSLAFREKEIHFTMQYDRLSITHIK